VIFSLLLQAELLAVRLTLLSKILTPFGDIEKILNS